MSAVEPMTPAVRPFYRSAAAEAAVHRLYDEARAALPFPTEEREIATRVGRTHLLVAGPDGGPDVVVLQGGNMVSPLTTGWLAPLADRVRLWGDGIRRIGARLAPFLLDGAA